MKKIITLITLSLAIICFAQAQIPPQAFNYSAVARDAQSNPIASTTIGVQITILKTSTTGASQYQENHFVNTDQYGLFNLIIGAGAVQSGSMSAIDWSADNFYLKVGMDANGGTSFLTMGTTQLLSVPYALHAATADSVIGSTVGGGIGFDKVTFTGVITSSSPDTLAIAHNIDLSKILNVSTVGKDTNNVWHFGTSLYEEIDTINNGIFYVSCPYVIDIDQNNIYITTTSVWSGQGLTTTIVGAGMSYLDGCTYKITVIKDL
jgi:hypothetical protein